MDIAKPQLKRIAKEYMEERFRKRYVDGGLQIQLLEEDGESCTGYSWMETGGLWTVIHWH